MFKEALNAVYDSNVLEKAEELLNLLSKRGYLNFNNLVLKVELEKYIQRRKENGKPNSPNSSPSKDSNS